MNDPGRRRAVESPLEGTVVRIEVGPTDVVRSGEQLVVIESMKMEHVIAADWDGVVIAVSVTVGQLVKPGDPLLTTEERTGVAQVAVEEGPIGPHRIRDDLAEAQARHEFGLDEARPDAVERRRRTGLRTTRENVNDLV